ncbi:helix-turn-helix DNA-binding domain protein [Mycobacterium phage Yecey3]|uniref:Helix-turn-helix DNA-binding domain protein n=1 Tax=Mycobacterium phage Yecey3 TaxID=2656617 RepID=A0A649V907_9CAUD|nr:HTH DNA binding protein [Mycobacterium phage Yecey3]QGJ88800.1 helix-turn-helix DNA-binding domain protein [Mycobacterium phage Yecey3]
MTDTIVDVTEAIDTLKRGIEVVLGENEKLLASNNELRAQKAYLGEQLATAKRVFGEAFCSGFTGATRPNRPKLTAQDARDIRAARAGGAKQADLARNYGVNPATISRIVNRVYH